MIRNRELFRKIADTIEKDPKSYNQQDWGCGTSFCVAGHAAHLSGCKPSYVNDDGSEAWDECFPPDNETVDVSSCDHTTYGAVDTGDYAILKLGISDDDSDVLFGKGWVPPEGMTVPDALRAIGDGAEIDA